MGAPAYADLVFSRTVAFVQATRWARRPDHDMIVDHLSRQRIIITGDSELLRTAAGQHAVILLVNLIARFCPLVEANIPANIGLSVANSNLVTGNNLHDAVAGLPDRVWGAARPLERISSDATDLVLHVGSPPQARSSLGVQFGHWWGAVSEGESSQIMNGRDIAGPGPLTASCLAASAAYKAVIRRLIGRHPDYANDNTHWDLRGGSQCLSLLDYALSPSDGPRVVPRYVVQAPVTFVSAGAISSAVAYAIHNFGLRLSAARVFDPKLIDPPDLNRYITIGAADVDRSKSIALSEWLMPDRIDCKVEAFDPAAVCQLPVDHVFVVGVDHIPSRWLAQKASPATLLIGATEHDEVRVSAHRRNRAGICAVCLDPQDHAATSGELIPTISFVSALSGLMIAAELMKTISPNLAEYQLSNVAGGRLLQLVAPMNWQHRLRQPVAGCPYCAA